MSKFYLFSIALHLLIIGTALFINRANFKPLPKLTVYKVSLAPLPQPNIQETEVQEESTKKVPEKKEKRPPAKKKTKKKKKTAPKKSKKAVKKGLPDIKPRIMTGSGRGFTYSYYLNIMLNKINRNWHNPYKGKDVGLRTIVYFEVDRNGRIYNVRVEEGSGDNLYNEMAIRAVTTTKKLPPLPQEFANDYLKVHLEFLTAR